jgi:hypothetical protein
MFTNPKLYKSFPYVSNTNSSNSYIMDSIKKKMESLSTEKEAATARANKFEEEAMSWGR